VTRLRIGTRGSELARWQSDHVAGLLRALGHDVEVQIFTTRGDVILDKPLPEIGGKGLFTAELEAALRQGVIDLAVHSLKDLPTEDAPGLAVVAIPERADPRDALVGPRPGAAASLAGLPRGARVGTSSLRRRAQLLEQRPDLRVLDVRGNVGTRLRKLDEGQYDALLLACAGLDRLGLGHRIDVRLGGDWLCAAGQGALGIQGRADDDAVNKALAALDHPATRTECEAERGVLAGLGGGCSLPLGVRAVAGAELLIQAALLLPDGTDAVRARGSSAEQVIRSLHDGQASRILDALA
jgi:hydroxymethylbilane synthase